MFAADCLKMLHECIEHQGTYISKISRLISRVSSGLQTSYLAWVYLASHQSLLMFLGLPRLSYFLFSCPKCLWYLITTRDPSCNMHKDDTTTMQKQNWRPLETPNGILPTERLCTWMNRNNTPEWHNLFFKKNPHQVFRRAISQSHMLCHLGKQADRWTDSYIVTQVLRLKSNGSCAQGFPNQVCRATYRETNKL